MGRPINGSLRQSWRSRINEQLASGLSVAAFCRQHAIAVNSFYAWRRRLMNESARPAATDRAISSARPDARSTEGALESRSGSFLRVAWPVDASIKHLEAILPDQTRLRIPGEHLAAWELTLRTLLSSAERQPLLAPTEREVRHV